MKEFVFETLEQFKEFNIINENMAFAKKILAKHHIDPNDVSFEKLIQLLGNNLGYIGKFTEFLYEDRETFESIEEIFKMIKNIGLDVPIERFKTITDPKTRQTKRGLDSLYDYLQAKLNKTKLGQVLNGIPSMARKKIVTDKLVNLISMNVEHAETIRKFYAKKGGRYKDAQSIYDDTLKLINNLKGEYNLNGIKKFLEDNKLNYDIMLERDDLLIIQINDYNTCKKAGSSHWCIATSQNSWESYVGLFNNQYIVYNFAEPPESIKSQIGLTVNPSGKITYAYYKDDSEVKSIPKLEEEIGID